MSSRGLIKASLILDIGRFQRVEVYIWKNR